MNRFVIMTLIPDTLFSGRRLSM